MLAYVALAAIGLVVVFWRCSARIISRGPCLVVIAHPDDECMFFAPTISSVDDVYILCLSTGNYEGLGVRRRVELYLSAVKLGISPARVKVVDDGRFIDCPDAQWNADSVAAVVVRHVRDHGVRTVVTFDEHGVSGHANHCALYHGVRRAVESRALSDDVDVYALDSVNIIRKYSGPLDAAWCLLRGARPLLLGRLVAAQAMLQHRSQLRWFRLLYIVFSRYMYVNTLRRLTPREAPGASATPAGDATTAARTNERKAARKRG